MIGFLPVVAIGSACNKRPPDDTIISGIGYGPLAQLVEQGTLNALVLGSSPRRLREKLGENKRGL